MFKRNFEIKMTKPDPSLTPKLTLTEEQRLERIVYYQAIIKNVAYDAGKIFAAYILLDTYRKVHVAKAMAGVCCKCKS